MKKYLLLFLTVVLALPMMAAGNGSGTTIANAIEFDWENGNTQEAGSDGKWYRIDLGPLYDLEEPALSIHITNLSQTDAAHLYVRGVVASQEETREYTIAAQKSQIWSQNAQMLQQLQYSEVHIFLRTDQAIAITARAYEAVDVDEGCVRATELVLNGSSAEAAAGESWYKLDLSGLQDNQEIQLQATSTGATDVRFALSTDCPSTGVTEYTYTATPSSPATHLINRAWLDMLAVDELYVRLAADQATTLAATTVAQSASGDIFSGEARDVPIGQQVSLDRNTLYRVRVADLVRDRYQPEIKLTNTTSATFAQVTATFEVAFQCPTTSVITRTYKYNEQLIESFAPNILASTDAEYVYFRVSWPVGMYIRLKHVREGDACRTSVDFEYEKVYYQDPSENTVWYAVDIKEAKEQRKNIELTISNYSDERATIVGHLAFACPYIDQQTLTRSLAGHTTIDKTIEWSLFSKLTTDTVYVGVETDRIIRFNAYFTDAETKEPDETCAQAIPFDWTSGHIQKPEDGAVWYAVALKDVDLNKLPTINIYNRGTAAAHINGEMSVECPDVVENVTRNLTIAANGDYHKDVSRDLLQGWSQDDVAYFKITTDQEIFFNVSFREPDAGSTCDNPIDFNWVGGNDQEAGANLWYRVDLTEAKESGKDIRLSVSNRSHNESQLVAGIAFECPCEIPQSQRLTLSDMQTRTTTIRHSFLETFDENVVYIRLSSSEMVHVQARLVDPEPFEEIPCPTDAIEFAWEQTYTTTEDVQWFHISKAVLEEMLTTTNTPRLTINAHEDVTITAKVAFRCPITEEMQSRTIRMSRGDVITKLIERTTAEQMATVYDEVYVQLYGKGIEFVVNLVDPNTGSDCLHAIPYNIGDELTQEPNTTQWYRLNKADIIALDRMITFGVQNLNGVGANVRGALYNDCDSAALLDRNLWVGANATRDKRIASDLFAGFTDDILYVAVTTAANQRIRIFSYAEEHTPIPPIEACQDAVNFFINTDFVQAAGTEVWYRVPLRDIQETTSGDGVLTIRNTGETDAIVKGELSWECPVEHEMTSRTRTIPQGGELVYNIQRNQLMAFDSTYAYVRVTTDQALSFRFDITRNRGGSCLTAIDFDWKDGNIHPGGCLWYQVELNQENLPEGKDLRLCIVNLDRQNATDMSALITWECDEENPLRTLSHTLAAGDTIFQDIDRDLVETIGWPNLQIYFCSDEQTHIYVELIDEMPPVVEERTIDVALCDGATYTYTTVINDQTYIFEQTVFNSDPATHTLDQTVTYRQGTVMHDSIWHFRFTPMIAIPQTPAETLAEIGATPLLVEGMKVFVDSSLAVLNRYYAAIDSFARIDTLYWSADPNGATFVDTTTVLPRDTRSMTLYLHIEDSCENRPSNYPYTFVVEPWRIDQQTQPEQTVCAGTTIETRLNPSVLIERDTIIRDTLQNIAIVDLTYHRERLIDSLYIYNVYVYRAPDSLYTAPVNALVQREWLCGNTLSLTQLANVGRVLRGQFAAEFVEADHYVAIDEIVWERSNLDGTYTPITADIVCHPAEPLIIRYGAVTACEETLYSSDFEFTVTAIPIPELTEAQLNTLGATPILKQGMAIYLGRSQQLIQDYYAGLSEYTSTIATCLWTTDEEGTAPVDGTPIARGTNSVTLYLQLTDECGSEATFSFTFTPETWRTDEVRQAERNVCPGTEVTIGEETHTITADVEIEELLENQEVTDTETGLTRLIDVRNIYPYFVYRTPASLNTDLVQALLDRGWACGETLTTADLDAVRTQLLTYFSTNFTEADHYAPVTNIAWERQDANGTSYTAITTDIVCSTQEPLIIRYSVLTECDETLYSADFEFDITPTVATGETYYEYMCAGETFTWEGETYTQPGTYTYILPDATTGCDIRHTLVLALRALYMPAFPADVISPVCGLLAETTAATDFILAAIAQDPDYATDPTITWYLQRGEEWLPAENTPVDGTADELTLRCVIASECTGTQIDTVITRVVEQPTADNDASRAELPAKSLYGHRLLMININQIREQFPDWTIQEADVVWYRMLGATPEPATDEQVGTGFYYTTSDAAFLSGSYYAEIEHVATSATDCGGTARTVILAGGDAAAAPELHPSHVSPAETIRVINLNPTVQTEIIVYSSTGQLVATYTSKDADEFLMQAADNSGYYMVDVQSDGAKTTLRYVVK